MKVSIIIPAYNEENYIEETLLSLRKQDYSPIEIIVVANACSDKTVKKAKKLSDKVLDVKKRGISNAKNKGADAASGEIYFFLDADTSLPPTAISKVVKTVQKGKTCGRMLWKSRDRKGIMPFIISTVENMLQSFYTLSKIFPEGSGACLFVTKKVYVTIKKHYGKGWNTNLVQLEDIDFIKRLKTFGDYTCIFKPLALTSFRRHKLRFLVKDELKEFFMPHKERDWDKYR